MPRLLVVTSSYPVEDNPASGIFVQKILQHLPPTWQITVLTPATAQDHRVRREGRILVHPVVYAPRRWMRLAHAPGGIMPQLQRQPALLLLVPLLLLSLAWRTLRLARHHDLIYANWAINGAFAGLVGQLLHRPVVLALRGSDVHGVAERRLKRWVLRQAAGRARCITAVSEDFAQAARPWLAAQAPLSVLPNGVDEALLHLPLPQLGQHIEIMALGSLIPVKDHRTLILALQALRDHAWHLRIFGEGPERERLQGLIEHLQLQDRISLPGAIPPQQVPAALAAHAVFIHPSLAEGRSNAVLEAMAAGRIIIASDIASQRELLAPDAGLLFAPGQVNALRAALTRLWQEPAVDWGRHARQHLCERGLTWPSAGERLHRILASCLH